MLEDPTLEIITLKQFEQFVVPALDPACDVLVEDELKPTVE